VHNRPAQGKEITAPEVSAADTAHGTSDEGERP
jgi:hypothetical protein